MSDAYERPDRGAATAGNSQAANSQAANSQAANSQAANSQAGNPPGTSADDEATQLARLRQEISDAKDRELRTLAELENYRKRARRELEDERRFAHQHLLLDLLPVLDNVGRAIEAAEKAAEAAAVTAGFKMVAQQLEQVLTRYHCTRIEALHQPFDPHRHQAIMQQPSDEYPPGTVLLVAQQGYQLHDRVLRPAQVIVSE
jgi:molecular chaperone GrpE